MIVPASQLTGSSVDLTMTRASQMLSPYSEAGAWGACQCLQVTGTDTISVGAEDTVRAAGSDCEQREEKSGLLERCTGSKSKRRACGPGRALESSCLVTASMRVPVTSTNSLLPKLVGVHVCY